MSQTAVATIRTFNGETRYTLFEHKENKTPRIKIVRTIPKWCMRSIHIPKVKCKIPKHHLEQFEQVIRTFEGRQTLRELMAEKSNHAVNSYLVKELINLKEKSGKNKPLMLIQDMIHLKLTPGDKDTIVGMSLREIINGFIRKKLIKN